MELGSDGLPLSSAPGRPTLSGKQTPPDRAAPHPISESVPATPQPPAAATRPSISKTPGVSKVTASPQATASAQATAATNAPQNGTQAESLANPESTPKSWLRSWRRITQPTPPDIDTDSVDVTKATLLQHGPFHIGFFVTLGGLAAYTLVSTAQELTTIILLGLLSVTIALGLNPAVDFFHSRGLRRGLSVFIVAVFVLALVVLLIWAILPMVSSQITALGHQLPTLMSNLRENPQFAQLDEQFDIIDSVNKYISEHITSGEIASILAGGVLGTVVIAIGNTVFYVMVTLVMTIYFLMSLPKLKTVLYNLSPASRRPRMKYLVNEILKRIGGYISGLFLVSFMAAIVTFIVTYALGMAQFSLALAALLMLFYYIPLIGSSIAIIIISIIGFTQSPLTGILCLAILFAYQQFDAYFIQPRVFSRSVQVPGVLVIIGAISGATLFGMIGAILAVPLIAAMLLLYREVLIPHLDKG